MTRGQALELFLCYMGGHASMRVWPVKYDGKDIPMCEECIDEAARRGGFTKAMSLGQPTIYLAGPDIRIDDGG